MGFGLASILSLKHHANMSYITYSSWICEWNILCFEEERWNKVQNVYNERNLNEDWCTTMSRYAWDTLSTRWQMSYPTKLEKNQQLQTALCTCHRCLIKRSKKIKKTNKNQVCREFAVHRHAIQCTYPTPIWATMTELK